MPFFGFPSLPHGQLLEIEVGLDRVEYMLREGDAL